MTLLKNTPGFDLAALGYLAGMIDGDGSIYLRSSSVKHNRYRVSVSIRNTYKPMLDQVESWCGGIIPRAWSKPPCSPRCTEAHVHKRKRTYRWEANGLRGVILLEALEPYLIEKRSKATTLLESYAGKEWLRLSGTREVILDMRGRGWAV